MKPAHCFQRCWHPSCWFLETAYCSTSHDSSCCAHQMLITECVTFQPESCHQRLQKPIDTGSLDDERELVHPVAGSLSCISVHESSRTGSFVWSLLTLYRVRTHVACLIVHGRIGEVCCHFKRRDFVFENCKICSQQVHDLWRRFSSRRHCSDALCGDTRRRICQPCPSGRHYLATLSSSN